MKENNLEDVSSKNIEEPEKNLYEKIKERLSRL